MSKELEIKYLKEKLEKITKRKVALVEFDSSKGLGNTCEPPIKEETNPLENKEENLYHDINWIKLQKQYESFIFKNFDGIHENALKSAFKFLKQEIEKYKMLN